MAKTTDIDAQIAHWEANGWPENQIDVCRRTARVLGQSSAAQQAIADYERREVAGENPICLYDRKIWLVIGRSEPELQPAT
jgi:hypothetical protein